ncbi:lipocalin family protein [Pseudomonas sp. N040]|uniref:lipocalin family protein n=1 Tax=Pseudomonas sp. N040 TaxID=2785325 RepID=UPI0018A2F137|nr:lipocalin family protein [Pseudomonas sp. N040]MBF7730611.1 lipocalin family protein [Pseudomonas sp. N040]MBW7014254.1 lipocalin family protein [Pseudomonas sp. N040]
MRAFTLLLSLLLTACTGLPEGVTAVQPFDANRYLGTWYEIARLDHSFERGLEQVSAHYSLREDGGIRVLNRGYSPEEQQWKEAEGKAYLMGGADQGYLKVSFFGPFYGAYGIFALDQQDYQYAFVSGYSTDYLWLLARTPTVSPELIERFKAEAAARGFATDRLILVRQQPR